jgi:hypothetical protein
MPRDDDPVGLGSIARDRSRFADPPRVPTVRCVPGSYEPLVCYEGTVASLTVDVCGQRLDVTSLLGNGRGSYLVFQHIVATAAGLRANSEGNGSDLTDDNGRMYEVKAFKDVDLHPNARHDWFHTAASATFGPNNLGPTVKRLVNDGRYADAFELCRATGYAKNEYYIYTNTSGFRPSVPLRFVVVPTAVVTACLSPTDPRLVSRRLLLAHCTDRRPIQLAAA